MPTTRSAASYFPPTATEVLTAKAAKQPPTEVLVTPVPAGLSKREYTQRFWQPTLNAIDLGSHGRHVTVDDFAFARSKLRNPVKFDAAVYGNQVLFKRAFEAIGQDRRGPRPSDSTFLGQKSYAQLLRGATSSPAQLRAVIRDGLAEAPSSLPPPNRRLALDLLNLLRAQHNLHRLADGQGPLGEKAFRKVLDDALAAAPRSIQD